MVLFRRLLLLLLVTIIVVGCKDLFDNKGNADKSALGNAYDILLAKGDYSYFLKALEISNYKRLISGGGLVTVFAPNDAAFKEYLASNYQTEDLTAVPVNDLTVLIGYHIIQFSYNTDELLAFSMSSAVDGEPLPDAGSCYKYKTYARADIQTIKAPNADRMVSVFSREKYLPIISTRLFESRGSSDPEKDYKQFFPNVNWKGADDKLYIGDAAVMADGVATDNGYLYTIDKVAKPLPTIYEALNQNWAADYSTYKALFDRFSYFQYSESFSKNYADLGDSLFLFFHFKAPQASMELPEIASEWSYHDEEGVVFDRGMRYASHCFAVNNQTLEPFIKEYFSEFCEGQSETEYLKAIPDNSIYHLLMAQSCGKRDIIIPSELEENGVVGNNGERFRLDASQVRDVKFCANGVIYGTDKIFMPAVFTNLTRPLFQYPQYQFYAMAFNTKNMYQLTVDPNNRYTLFIHNDETLIANNYTFSESSAGFGSYELSLNRKVMSDADISNMLMSYFVYGTVTSPADEVDPAVIKYYVSKDNKTYFYVYDGQMHDVLNTPINIVNTYQTDNGVVYNIDKLFKPRNTGIMVSLNNSAFSNFKALMKTAGLIDVDNRLTFSIKDVMAFLPDNETVTNAVSEGKIPTDSATLNKYLRFHFVPLQKNKLDHYLLPGIGPEGVESNTYSIDAVTNIDYINEADVVTINISWDNLVPNNLILTDHGGNRISTVNIPNFHTNAAVYTINECFDVNTMYGTTESVNPLKNR